MKKIVSVLLCVCLILSVCSVALFASAAQGKKYTEVSSVEDAAQTLANSDEQCPLVIVPYQPFTRLSLR